MSNSLTTTDKDSLIKTEGRAFDISAKTFRLWKTTDLQDVNGFAKESLLDGETHYIIPIYQREYSWGYDQISRFVRDIFRGFWGVEEEKFIIEEPMFIGTMQLSFREQTGKDTYKQDVIDGQQRLSTFLCLIKYLKLSFPNNSLIQNIPIGWLETRVNNGKEEVLLNEMLNIKTIEDNNIREKRSWNRYIDNLYIIDEVVKEIIMEDDRQDRINPYFIENIDVFVTYLLNNVFMVVVETFAGLSKTIQIFNTINTTGLDLGGDDLFKVRFYEYLRDKKGAGEDAFEAISEVYKKVKDINDKWRVDHNNNDIISVNQVRTVYKNYLIAKFGLQSQLFRMATDTFYEYLFDVLLNVQEHKEIRNLNGLQMSIEDLEMVIEACYQWNSCEYKDVNQMIAGLLIEKSRYSRYSDFAYQVMIALKGKNIEARIDSVMKYYKILCRIFFCYSMMYLRQVYEIHDLMDKAYKMIIQSSDEETTKFLLQKLNSIDRERIKGDLGWTIAYNRICKDLLCCLSAFFDEIATTISIKELENKLSYGYDIEHIHANADENIEMDEALQNSIGNLMLLEYDINRSIGAGLFNEKVNGISGRMSYKDSGYATVKKIASYPQWNTEEAKQRKEEEIKKVMDFIFDCKDL